MDLIQYLLNDGVNASKRDCLGRTYLDILESNVQDDLENFGIDKFGRTILHWASVDESKKGMLNDHCKYLIQRQDDVGRTALMYASYPLFQNPQPEYVSMLIEMGENPNAYDIGGKRALHFAAAIKENTMIIKILLQAGADREAVDHMGQTALDIAQKCNNVENVKLLQNYFYNPSSDSNTLFMLNSKKITDDSGTLETASQTGRCNFSTSPSQYRI